MTMNWNLKIWQIDVASLGFRGKQMKDLIGHTARIVRDVDVNVLKDKMSWSINCY